MKCQHYNAVGELNGLALIEMAGTGNIVCPDCNKTLNASEALCVSYGKHYTDLLFVDNRTPRQRYADNWSRTFKQSQP